ncbi:hypothetical protein yc1106_00858 [Curvularia clavata]|uniref:Apple domain-containing protein n=1 Tax=Curvularia clavata TaxID=95742 RepID=A0A9Q9DPF1_CURCL|nr:hypothetical protein yc1106_00858 [Curvularia clavata]
MVSSKASTKSFVKEPPMEPCGKSAASKTSTKSLVGESPADQCVCGKSVTSKASTNSSVKKSPTDACGKSLASKSLTKSLAKQSATEPCGKSVRSAEGLQIAEIETYPEAVHRYTPTRDTKLPQLHDHSVPDEEASICSTRLSQERISFRLGPGSDHSGCGTTLEVPPDLVKRFYDHRRRRFCFIIVFTLFILGAVIAASIGGSLYVQERAQKAAAAAADKTEQTLAPNTTAAAVEAPDASQGSSGTYSARPFSAIQLINSTCPSTILVSSQLEGKANNISGRYAYDCLDSTDILDGSDLMAFTAYTLEQCVDACSQYSAMANKNETCKAVVINSQFLQSYETGNGANCWLKGTAESASKGKTGYTAAILRKQ